MPPVCTPTTVHASPPHDERWRASGSSSSRTGRGAASRRPLPSRSKPCGRSPSSEVDLTMAPTAPEIKDILRWLRATPRHFDRTAPWRTGEKLRRPPEEGSWSMNEGLADVRGAADVQGGWIDRMLADDTPTLRYASPRTGMRKGGYAADDFQDSLRA